MHVSISSEYWIKPNALTIELNYFDSPNYIQVGLLSNAVIMAYSEGIIDFNQAHNFRTWNLVAQDTFLNSAQSVYVYARLERDESKKEALIIYDKEYRAIDGSIMNEGSVIGNPSEKYFYILLGKISSSTDSEGKERMREWEQILSYGTLKTDYQNTIDGNDKFLLKKFYDLLIHTYDDKMNRVPSNSTGYDIEWLEIAPKLKALFARFESSETRIANILEKIVFKDSDNSKEIIDLATSEEIGNTTKTADNIAASTAWVNNSYLSKVKPDSTAYLLKLLGGAEFGQFIENLPTRTGAKIDSEGNGMFTTLSAKQMRILTLIINKLTALAGDFVMTESGEIESVERIDDRTFRLTMVRKHDNDITDLEVDDVLRANLEDLKVNNVSYMGWYRVLSKNTQDNTLNVVMYPASECEGNVNYPPVANMIVHRWGNATNEERQRCWYISSPEGRIVYLTGVYKPKLESSNYSSFYGLPVMLDFLNDKGINPKEPYLWVRGLIVQDIIRVDYQGNVEADIVDRGLYDPAVARGPDPYLCRAKRSTNGRFETHDVWANSCRYRCLKTGTLEVPKWNAVDWVQISGDTELYIKFEKPNGDAFFDVIDCPIIVHVFRGVEEITEDIPDTDIAWSRESGDAASDLAWPSQHPNEKKKIHLVDADCPGESTRFTCTVYVRDGESVREVQAIETINN